MWQALKALWGKIAGQAPPVPSTSTADSLQKPVGSCPTPSEETPEPEPTAETPTPEPPQEETSEPATTPSSAPTLEIPTPTVETANLGEETSQPVVAPPQEKSAHSAHSPPETPQARQTPIFSAQPTPTAESINSFWAKSDIGSRISSIAASTDSGHAVSSISIARLRQPE